jgi:beta-mannosidase
MARVATVSGDTTVSLTANWSVALARPDEALTPDAAQSCRWIPARVPGTIGRDLAAPEGESLHDYDVWYRCHFDADGPQSLYLRGLAGIAEVFLDDRLVVSSASMFIEHCVDFDGRGRHALAIRFKALARVLADVSGPRARWRPIMIVPSTLRHVRISPLGHMPGWAPQIPLIGPWKPVEIVARRAPFRVASLRLVPSLLGASGHLAIDIRLDRPVDAATELACATARLTLDRTGPDRFSGVLVIDSIAPWWPHTHGEPALHRAHLKIGDTTLDLGRIGFRKLAVDRGVDGRDFALRVNDQPIFCRGASWMPPDPLAPGSADPRAYIAKARDAGMNMLRISGTATPESEAFYYACDEAGLLVWHDLPFANFDYPTTETGFAALIETEVRQLLDGLQTSPSLAIVCGGSEIAQQATMLGLKPAQAHNGFFEETAPALVAELAPQAVYVPHTPWGGPLPFVTDEGVTHYFGVGAYRRPMQDVRHAQVRFATECLAFANVPSVRRLRDAGLSDPADPRWKAGVPRDLGAEWDFEDVRDHYVGTLYGVDAEALRTSDPQRYLALGRAAPAELAQSVFAEWRRAGSSCGGGLLWFLNDLAPGAGWGALDDRGDPKCIWYALRRAFQPIHLGITDEGLNGLALHLGNETQSPRTLLLSLMCFGGGPHPSAKAERNITLGPRESVSLSSNVLLGRFFDITYAYRFGPLAHDATIARLLDPETGAIIAEATHVLQGRAATPRDIGLAAEVTPSGAGFALAVRAERFARFVTIDDEQFMAADQGFCLVPGERRIVPLSSASAVAKPAGVVAALNSSPFQY